MDKKPRRKNLRLRNFDYSQAGYYFVTICTKDKQKLLSSIVKGGSFDAATIELTLIGKEIVKTIDFIENQSANILFDKYVIMPNHLHAIIILQGEPGGDGTRPYKKLSGS